MMDYNLAINTGNCSLISLILSLAPIVTNRPVFLVTTILGAAFAVFGIVLRVMRVQKMAHAFGKDQYIGANM